MNTWLNVATALGTIGSVIVSLFLSGKETRSRKKQELENKKKLVRIIELSLSNIVNKMERYQKITEKTMLEFPYEDTEPFHKIRRNNQNSLILSNKAYNIISKEVNTYRSRDYEYIVGQIDILRKLDLSVLPTDLIVIYHSSYTAAASLEQWLLRINGLNPITDPLIAYLNYYMDPLIKILNDLEKEIYHN